MSTYSIKCEYCGGRLEAETRYIGYEFPCPACKQSFVLPLTAMTAGMVAGGFWLQKRVGSGNISEVFVGKRLSTNEHVFIKVLSPLVTADRDVARQFLAAICAAAKFDSPGLVKPLEVVEANGHSFVVTPYVEGECLDVVVGRDGPLRERQALKLVLRAARVLRSLWDEHGLAHGDIKPANILVDGQENVHLLDAGNAKMLFRHAGLTLERLDRTGTIADYLSPEQARGDRPVDQRTDIYALGVTLYFLLTGAKPYAGADTTMVLQEHLNAPVPDPQDHNPEVSPGTRQLLFRMTAKAPVSRFQTWDELIDELKRRLEGTAPGTETRRIMRTCRDLDLAPRLAVVRPARRRPLPLAAILGGSVALSLLLCLIVGLVVVVRHWRSTPRPPPAERVAGGEPATAPAPKTPPPERVAGGEPPKAPPPALPAAGDAAVPPGDLVGTKILTIRRHLERNPGRRDFAIARLESFLREATNDGDRESIRAEIARIKEGRAAATGGPAAPPPVVVAPPPVVVAPAAAPYFRDFALLGPWTGNPDDSWNQLKPATGGWPDLQAAGRQGDTVLRWQRPPAAADTIDLRQMLPPPHDNRHVYALAALEVEAETEVQFAWTHAGDASLWINARAVVTQDPPREPETRTEPVRLGKGRKSLLLRVASGDGRWRFSFRVVKSGTDGERVPEVTLKPVELPAAPPWAAAAANDPLLGAWQNEAAPGEWLRFTPTHQIQLQGGGTTARRWRGDQGALTTRGYQGEELTPCQLADDHDTLTLTRGGAAVVFRRRAEFPDELSMEALPPPAAAPTPEEVQTAAQDLVRRGREYQALREELAKVTNGQSDAATLAKPEVEPVWARVQAADLENQKFLAGVAAKCGWPSVTLFGRDAAQAAYVMVLFCDSLRLVRTAAAGLEAEWQAGRVGEIAYAQLKELARFMMQEPLEYGLQGVPTADGKLLVPVIRDRAKVNANRQRIGQPPLEDLERDGMRILEVGD